MSTQSTHWRMVKSPRASAIGAGWSCGRNGPPCLRCMFVACCMLHVAYYTLRAPWRMPRYRQKERGHVARCLPPCCLPPCCHTGRIARLNVAHRWCADPQRVCPPAALKRGSADRTKATGRPRRSTVALRAAAVSPFSSSLWHTSPSSLRGTSSHVRNARTSPTHRAVWRA